MGKRFGWTDDDGLDSKDRIRANDLKEKAKKDDQKADGKTDPKDLPADTGNEGSGTAGVRKE